MPRDSFVTNLDKKVYMHLLWKMSFKGFQHDYRLDKDLPLLLRTNYNASVRIIMFVKYTEGWHIKIRQFFFSYITK